MSPILEDMEELWLSSSKKKSKDDFELDKDFKDIAKFLDGTVEKDGKVALQLSQIFNNEVVSTNPMIESKV
jgi:hypothetical protein